VGVAHSSPPRGAAGRVTLARVTDRGGVDEEDPPRSTAVVVVTASTSSRGSVGGGDVGSRGGVGDGESIVQPYPRRSAAAPGRRLPHPAVVGKTKPPKKPQLS
jgi:hypothetical protein